MTRTPTRRSALYRWGVLTGRRPWAVVTTWLVLVVLSFATALGAVTGEGLFDRLHSGDIVAPGEADRASALLDSAGGGGFTTDTLLVEGVADLADRDVARGNADAVQAIADVDGVASVVNPFVFEEGPRDPAAAPFVTGPADDPDGFATVVTYDDGLGDAELEAARAEVSTQLDEVVSASRATDSQRGSVQALVDAIIGQVGSDMKTGEGLALPVSFAIMVVVFGGFLAAGLPILGAVASIGGALATLFGFAHVIDLDATVVNIVTVLGLGLCIDYGLLVVSRFREEARGVLDGAPADTLTPADVAHITGLTLDRAGRTVIFSAVTVAISLTGLLFFPVVFMRASGAAGVSIVVLALLVGVSLIPALCALSARRLLRRGTEQAPDEGVFSRLASGVQRVPWAVIAVVLALLVTLALPALRLHLTSSGPEMLPKGAPERTFFETFREDYPDLAGADVTYVTTAPESEVTRWAKGAASELPGLVTDPVVETVGEQGSGAQVRVVELRTGDGGLGDASRDLVDALHEQRPPFAGHIGGQASGLHDFTDVIAERAPYAVLTVVLATFLLLFLMTGSLVVPLKALVMNVVSLGASLGALVWVFQDGHLEGVLGFTSTGGVEASIPILALAFGFGLSMDYEVFLLSRVVELHEQGHPTDEAVRLGLQRSGRIITSAALLMVVVFSGFVLAQVLAVKQTGVALVLAIVIDATLVRMLLVPATMSVLGEWNWWAPRWMKGLHERVGITE